jgi:hypothetical protein
MGRVVADALRVPLVSFASAREGNPNQQHTESKRQKTKGSTNRLEGEEEEEEGEGREHRPCFECDVQEKPVEKGKTDRQTDRKREGQDGSDRQKQKQKQKTTTTKKTKTKKKKKRKKRAIDRSRSRSRR